MVLFWASTGAAAHAGTSSLESPSVTFETPGSKVVTLRVCGPGGCTETQQTVIVLDPVPQITSATVSTASAEVGQLVRLEASGSGKPALAFSWRVLRAGNLIATISGASAYWNTGNLSPGSYVVVLHLSNAEGAVESAPLPVTLAANAATDFFTVPPCRLFDSRNLGQPLVSGVPKLLPGLLATCQIPLNARALAANVTVIGGTGSGSVKVYPGNYPVPVEAVVSFAAGSTRANFGVLPVSTDGLASLQALAAMPPGTSVHLLVDVTGYFAP